MSKMVRIGEAAKLLGVTPQTLRRWEADGRIEPAERSPGGSRYYDVSLLTPAAIHGSPKVDERKTVAYARVSSPDQKPDQKDDLERQKQALEAFCAANGWQFEIVSDQGSGMNYRKKGLKRLLEDIVENRVGRLVITHKDRLLRLGAELVFAICEAKDVEIVILNKGEDTSFEEDLASDVLEIITVFSARLYGARSRKNAKMLSGLKDAVEAGTGKDDPNPGEKASR